MLPIQAAGWGKSATAEQLTLAAADADALAAWLSGAYAQQLTAALSFLPSQVIWLTALQSMQPVLSACAANPGVLRCSALSCISAACLAHWVTGGSGIDEQPLHLEARAPHIH